MDTKLTRIRYSKALKSVLAVLFAFLLFLSGMYALLVAKAFFAYGLPEETEFENTRIFYDQLEVDMRNFSDFALYNGGNITKDSPAYIKALDNEKASIDSQLETVLSYLDRVEWLSEHPPELFYAAEYGKYLDKDQYVKYLRGDYDGLYEDDFSIPATTQKYPEPTEVTDTALLEETTAEDITWEASTEASTESGQMEKLFPNWKYDDYWKNYMQEAGNALVNSADNELRDEDMYSLTNSESIEGLQFAAGSLSREKIINFYENKKLNLELDSSFWQSFREYAERVCESAKELKNLKFAVLDKKSGAVYSNFAQENTDRESLRAKTRDGGAWSLIFTEENRAEYSSAKYYDASGGHSFWDSGLVRTLQDFTGTYRMTDQLNGWTSGINSIFSDYYESNNFELYLYLTDDREEGDAYYQYKSEFTALSVEFQSNINAFLILFFLASACGIYLVAVAGRNSKGELALLPPDRIYHDLHFIVSGGLILAAGVFLIEGMKYLFYDYPADNVVEAFIINKGLPLLIAAAGLIALEWLISVSRNSKNKHFIKNTLIYKLLLIPKWLLKKARSLYRRGKNVLTAVFSDGFKSLKKTIIWFALGYIAINVVLFFIWGLGFAASSAGIAFLFTIFIAAFNIAVMLLLFKSIKGLDLIMTAARSIRSGNHETYLNLFDIPAWLQPFAKDILDNQAGLREAVAEAVKGERMKAELITNVSHDLKTPLTAIVSYVALLKQCDIGDEDAAGYINVLDEKADRLKRLIEDLVEASKASTGNITLNLVHVNLRELANQAIGENSDDLEERGLEVRLNTVEEAVVIQADSQRTWRVIDNLFSNAKKYAMPNTRIYVDVKKDGAYGVFEMKNISRDALNIPAGELTQRFVRGDEARGGDGSGLGLSIAKSLCDLQGGQFEISIDGDLFKATVKLPLLDA